MKKLFISCPMKGRTEENIRNSMERMRKMAELIFDQELEVIPTYIEDAPPTNAKASLWCLGESIKKMAEADYFIGVEYSPFYKGCMVEWEAASAYDIPRYCINYITMMPDAAEIERKAFGETENNNA